MRKRKLLTHKHLVENVIATVEISSATRVRMMEGLTSQWNRRKFSDLNKAYQHLKPQCCYLSYRFLSLLEVIDSFEKSAKLTEKNYMQLFYSEKRGGHYDIGSVAVTRAIREIVENSVPPELPPVNIITGLSTSNLDEGNRLRKLKHPTEEERIELDDHGNLTLVKIQNATSKKWDETTEYLITVRTGVKDLESRLDHGLTDKERAARDHERDTSELRKAWKARSAPAHADLDCKYPVVQPLATQMGFPDRPGQLVLVPPVKRPGLVEQAQHMKQAQTMPQHYVYILTEVEGNVEEFLSSIRDISRDAWALTRTERKPIMSMIEDALPGVAESILAESTDDLFSRMERAVMAMNRAIHIPRAEINRCIELEREAELEEERKENLARQQNGKRAFASLGVVAENDHEDDYGVQVNPYSNFDASDVKNNAMCVGGSGWEQNKQQLTETDTTNVIKAMNEKESKETVSRLKTNSKDALEQPLSPNAKVRKASQDRLRQEKETLISYFYSTPNVESLDDFLSYNSHGDVEFERELCFSFIREYFEVPEKEILYFADGCLSLEQIFKGQKIVAAVNMVYDTLQRQLNLSTELLRAAELLNLPDPEVELRNMDEERKRRYEKKKIRLTDLCREKQRRKLAAKAELAELLAMEADSDDSDDVPLEHTDTESEESEVEEVRAMHLDRNKLKGTKMLVKKDTGKELLIAPDNVEELIKESDKVAQEGVVEVTRKAVDWLYRDGKGANLKTAIKESLDRKNPHKKLKAPERNLKGRVITSRQIAIWEDKQRKGEHRDEELLKLPPIEKPPLIDPSTFRHPRAIPQVSAALKLMRTTDEDIERRRKLREDREERHRRNQEREEARIQERDAKRDALRRASIQEDDFEKLMREDSEWSVGSPVGEEKRKVRPEDEISDGSPFLTESDSHGSDLSERPFSPHVFQKRIPEKADKTTKLDLVFSRYAMCDPKLLTKDIKTLLAVAKEQMGHARPHLAENEAANKLKVYSGWNPSLDAHPRVLIDLLATQYFRPPRFYTVKMDPQSIAATVEKSEQSTVGAYAVEDDDRPLLAVDSRFSNDSRASTGNHWSVPGGISRVDSRASTGEVPVRVASRTLVDSRASTGQVPVRVASRTFVDSRASTGEVPVRVASRTFVDSRATSGLSDDDLTMQSAMKQVVIENLAKGDALPITTSYREDPEAANKSIFMTLGTATVEAAQENKVRRNAYLVELSGSLDPFAKIFKDIVEDMCKKFVRFEQRHLVFELIGTAIGGPSFEFSSFSRREQADIVCFLAICRICAMFQRN